MLDLVGNPKDRFSHDKAHVIQGDLKIHAKVTDTVTGQRVGCYDVQLTIEAECSGFLCGLFVGR